MRKPPESNIDGFNIHKVLKDQSVLENSRFFHTANSNARGWEMSPTKRS